MPMGVRVTPPTKTHGTASTRFRQRFVPLSRNGLDPGPLGQASMSPRIMDGSGFRCPHPSCLHDERNQLDLLLQAMSLVGLLI